MSFAVDCSEDEFRRFRSQLDKLKVDYKYYMRKEPSAVTTFYIEVIPLTEKDLQIIRDYAREREVKVELEIDEEKHDILTGDLKELCEKAREAQERGDLVRGYHY
jgi:hypothetical protein